MTKKYFGYIKQNDTFGDCCRLIFKKNDLGTDRIEITDGVLHVFVKDEIVRIVRNFDINFNI